MDVGLNSSINEQDVTAVLVAPACPQGFLFLQLKLCNQGGRGVPVSQSCPFLPTQHATFMPKALNTPVGLTLSTHFR